MNDEMEKMNGEPNQENENVQPAPVKPPISSKINLSEISFFQTKPATPAPAPVAPVPETPAVTAEEQTEMPVSAMPEIPAPVFPPMEEEEAEEVVAEEVTEETEVMAADEMPEPFVEETPAPMAADEMPAPFAEEVVAEETPVEETTEETVAEEAPVEEATEETVAEETPAEETVEEAVAEETPVEETVEEAIAEEAPVEEELDEAALFELQQMQEAISAHYTKVLALLKYNKEKDANVNKLTKQLDEYRDGFGDDLKKKIAKSLISFREASRKTLANGTSVEKAKKNFEYLYLDMEDVLFDLGIEKIEDEEGLPTWMYNKQDINGNPKKVPMEEVVAPTYPELADRTLKKMEDVSAYLQECEQVIAETLRCDKVLVEQLGRYIEYSSWYEKGLQQALIYPIIRKITRVYDGLNERYAQANEGTDEEAQAAYMDALKWLNVKLEDILEYVCDITIEQILEGDEYDVRKHKLMRTVETENAEMNRKVAVVYSECYIYNDKVLIPAKVDVYKA